MAALNGGVLAGSAFLSPFALLAIVAGTSLLFLTVFSELGFVITTTLISHINDDLGISFELIRTAKWITVAFALVVTAWQFALREQWTKTRVGMIEKYFAVFILWGIVCLFFADRPLASLVEFGRLIGLYIIYLITKVTVRKKSHVIIVLALFTLIAFSSSLYSIASLMNGRYFRVRGFMNNPGAYAQFLTFVLPFVVAGAVLTRYKLLRYSLVVVTVIGILAVFLAWSRGSIIAAAIQITVILIAERRYRALCIAGAVAVALTAALFMVPTVNDIFYKVGRLQAGTTHRTTLWKSGIEAISDSPVFGKGFEIQVADVLHRVYWNDLSSALLYKDVSGRFHAHNHYIQATIATGVPGLVIFLAFLYYLIRNGIRDFVEERGRRRQIFFSAMLSVHVSFIFLSFFTTAPLFGSGTYANYFWISLGMVHAIKANSIEF